MILDPTALPGMERAPISARLVGSLIAALVVILVLSLALGVAPIHWTDGSNLLFAAGDHGEQIILLEMRLPRFCIAAISGAGLGAAGYLVQSALRNDLADPGLFGISAGAALAMAVVVVWQVDIGPGGLPLVTMVGGLGAGTVVLLAMRLTRDPAEMILFGVALGALFSAAILVLLLLANEGQVRTIYFFLVGSLIGKGLPDLGLELPWLSAALAGALLLIRPLDVLRLGDDMAEGLGVGAFRTRLLAILAAIGLVAPVVATCGPIGFISLLAPHAGRALLGRSDAAAVLPLGMLIGAVLLSGADLLARVVVRPGEWPVGLPVTLIGAPFVIYLLRRRSA
jgi:iron complex transport system permease protein